MKVRKNKELYRANKVFTDREEPKSAFWKVYESFRHKISSEEDIHVLTYYGIGGIGKTSLLKQLISEMDEKIQKPLYLYVDFNNKQELRNVLEGMRDKLASDYKFTFPVYDIAMYVYSKKIGEKVREDDTSGFIDKSPALSLIYSSVVLIPVIGIFFRYLALADKSGGFLRGMLSKRKRELSAIENEPVEILYQNLPYYFAQDLAENLRSSSEPLVVFFDTYEMLVNEMTSAGEPLNNDLWIRGSLGLIQNAPKVLWVIAGREKMKWAHFDREWADTLEQHNLGNLSESDARFFLNSSGIYDEKLTQSLYSLTNGTPVFLDLCVDNYFSLLERGKTPTIEDFGDNITSLVERYVRYMDDNKKDIAYFLSCLRVWDDKIFNATAQAVIPNHSFTTYEKIKGLSFVVSEEGSNFCYMHQTVCDILHRSCPVFIREKSESAIRRYYEDALASISITGIEFESVFPLYVKFMLPTINDAKGFTDFYGKLKTKLDLIDTSCQFKLLCEQMAVLSNYVNTIAPQTAISAQVHRDYSKYLINAGKYAKAFDNAEKAYTLYNRIFTETGEKTIDALNLMSQSRSLLGEHAESYTLIEKAYQLGMKHLGEEHPLTVDSTNRMANRLLVLGEYDKALEFNSKALALRQKIYGDDSPEALNTLETRATIYNKLGKEYEAADMNKHVFEKRSQLLGDKHPHTLSAMNNLAYRYVQMKRFDLAKPLAELSVDLHKEIHGENSINLAPSLDTLSECFSGLGEHEKAISLQKTVHEIYLDSLGPNHKTTLDSLDALRQRYAATGETM